MKIKMIVGFFCLLCVKINISNAQTVDLASIDEFFKVTSILKEGREISAEQWENFDNSNGYKELRQSTISIIKSSIDIVFGNDPVTEKDSILSISQKEMNEDPAVLLKKLILINYLDIDDNYESIKSFKENYDFNSLIEKAKQRLSSFLGQTINPTIEFKPVYFFFINADGQNRENGIYIDLNLVYKQDEDQRIDFLAHEFFHNYREKYVNQDYYKNDLAFVIDAIQNEGIADLIDKSEGYMKYFTDLGESPEVVESWVSLYNQAQEDLEKLQNLSIGYARNEIAQNDMIDEIAKTVRYNGHPIGFFMASHIVDAGYKSEMLKSFYNPYEFYSLYNRAAKKLNIPPLNDEFMDYLKSLTREYYP